MRELVVFQGFKTFIRLGTDAGTAWHYSFFADELSQSETNLRFRFRADISGQAQVSRILLIAYVYERLELQLTAGGADCPAVQMVVLPPG